MLPTTENDFNIELDFGDKVLHFRKWKGKERRLVNQLIKDGADIDAINNVLSYGCMLEQDTYLTQQEKLYVLYNLKKASLSDVFVISYACKECSEVNVEVVQILDIINPELCKLKDISVGDITFHLDNIINNKHNYDLLNSQKTVFDQKFYELVLRIRSISINNELYDNYDLNELVFFMDNLDSKIFDEVYDQFNEQCFSIDPRISCTCTNEECNHVSEIIIDQIPNFADEWL